MGLLIDLTGMIFGRLTVIKKTEKPEHVKKNNTYWLCECCCKSKTRKIICGQDLKAGHTKSCGCLRKEKLKNKNIKFNLTGQKFNHLTVIGRAKKPDHIKRGIYWLCECDCSNKTKKIIRGSELKNGGVQSCGCILQFNHGPEAENLIGQIFGRWVVIERVTKRKNNCEDIYWLCECQCELRIQKAVKSNSLKSGKSKSCGCMSSENTTKRFEKTREQSKINKTLWRI